MIRPLIVFAVFAFTVVSLCACSSSSSCMAEQSGAAPLSLGVSPLASGDGGASDASDDAWRAECANLHCSPAGVCGPQTTSTGTKAVCMEPC